MKAKVTNWRNLISQPKYGIRAEKDIFVKMRDGVRLAINIFRPDAAGQFPALLAIAAFGKDYLELQMPPQPLYKSAVWDGNLEAGDYTDIVPRGYVHIIADLRGTGHSEGEYPTPEGKDCYDLIEWIAGQRWCNGNVGMIGYGNLSAAQLKAAIEQPPHLKAIFVSHLVEDAYRDGSYKGGVLNLLGYGVWYGRHGTSGFAPNNAISRTQRTVSKEEFDRRRQELLEHPDIKHYPNLYHLLLYPQKNPRFLDTLLNPYDGPWYQQASLYPFYDKIRVPVFVVGKAAHENMSYFNVYNGLKTPKKLLVKPFGPEERPWREDLEEIIRWYDHWLKGNNTGIMDEPPIKLFVMGENKYRLENQWPLPGTEYVKCYLRRWEGLSFEPELHQDEPDGFFQEPLHLSDKRDGVKYLSPPLDEDLHMIGPASINFHASIDQDDTNWIVRLLDVSPNGKEERVSKGYLKASHRALDPKKSRPYAPYHPHTKESLQVTKPGEIYEYNVTLAPITNVFLEGHRIKLTIESLESPRDPEMQIHYHPILNISKTVLHKIYRNKKYQSHLVLPVVLEKRRIPKMREMPHALREDSISTHFVADYSNQNIY